MPTEPINYSDGQLCAVYVRVPGWLHNLIVEAARRCGRSINDWASVVLMTAAESDAGLPAPPLPHAPVPSPAEIVQSYLSGETVLEPCGRPSPCERATAGTHKVGGLEFCNHCRIRIG